MEKVVSRAAVLGGGAYGTAMAQTLGRKGIKVSMWVRERASSSSSLSSG
jgi:glycerol-3-phosphate dehydrogenase